MTKREIEYLSRNIIALIAIAVGYSIATEGHPLWIALSLWGLGASLAYLILRRNLR